MKTASREESVRYVRPRASVDESPDGRIRVTLEMPGVERAGLEVKVENGELRIRGRRPAGQSGRYVLRERVPGDYLKTYTLDQTVDTSKIDAVLEKGVLTLSLELKEQVKPRTIAVRAG
jgi:HSP20 family protein